MTKHAEIVVVGGGYAGVVAATRAARKLDGRVVLVSPDDTLVERIRLHEEIVHDRPVTHALSRFLEGTGVTHLRARVIGLDAGTKTLMLESGAIRYDRVVITVGSETRTPDVPGVAEHAFTLSSAHVERLRAALARAVAQSGRVVICGAGLTGVEIATELAERHPALRVSVLTAGEIGPLVSTRGRAHLRRVCARLGIAVHEGVRVTSVAHDHVVASGVSHAADVTIWAGGFEAPRIVRALGLATNALGQALVDTSLRAVGHEDIFVAGDAAAPVLGGRAAALPMGCKTALPQGSYVADAAVASLRGEPLRPFTFTDSLFCISLGRDDGLIQVLTPQGAVRDGVLTGRLAAMMKELVCRFTIGVLSYSRGLHAVLRGILSPRPPALAARTEARP